MCVFERGSYYRNRDRDQGSVCGDLPDCQIVWFDDQVSGQYADGEGNAKKDNGNSEIPVKYGDSEICHGFNEGRCRLDPCRYSHVCWSCKGRGHPSSQCPHGAIKPYDAPPRSARPCMNWNLRGCPGGCLCADRHCCLFCHRQHPLRHTLVCQWKFHREVEMEKRKPLPAHKSVKELMHLTSIGQTEHLRLSHTDQQRKRGEQPTSNAVSNTGASVVTPPPSTTIPATFMAKHVEAVERVSITEICVLFNTPSGCPMDHYVADSADGDAKSNGDAKCPLKHRCRECFGSYSLFECPFNFHGVRCFVVNDIVRYDEFPQRVFIVNGFVDASSSPSSASSARRKGKAVAPKIKVTEVGLDVSAAQIEVAASTLSKMVTSVQMQRRFSKLRIRELPTTISAHSVENKLKLLLHQKKIGNVVAIQSTASRSAWVVSFLSAARPRRRRRCSRGCCASPTTTTPSRCTWRATGTTTSGCAS